MTSRYRAAIVGLGQVGLLFDADAKRTGIWTHFSAYHVLRDRFDLVAVCDPDASRRDAARARAPHVSAFASLERMLNETALDVISLCTPPELHLDQIRTCVPHVRAIICEKPLGGEPHAARAVVETCRTRGVVLAVNYYKRFDGCVPQAIELLRDGTIGEVRAVTARYTGTLDGVGSHAIDLVQFFAGRLALRYATAAAADRYVAVLAFGDERLAVLDGSGPREDLIFEVDIVGSGGRLQILDNCSRLQVYRFAPSARYGGYRELVAEQIGDRPHAQRFLPLFVEVADALDGRRHARLTSDGASALDTQIILEGVRDAAQSIAS